MVMKLGGACFGYWQYKERAVISNKFDPSVTNKISIDELDNDFRYEPAFVATISMKLRNNHLVFSNEYVRGIWLQYLKSVRMI